MVMNINGKCKSVNERSDCNSAYMELVPNPYGIGKKL